MEPLNEAVAIPRQQLPSEKRQNAAERRNPLVDTTVLEVAAVGKEALRHPADSSSVRIPAKVAMESSKPQLSQKQEKATKNTSVKRSPVDLIHGIVAIDCGMVRLPAPQGATKKKRQKQKYQQYLRRVCIVDGTGRILLNETVRVPALPPSYQTKFAQKLSGSLPNINGSLDDLNVGQSQQAICQQAAALLRGRIVVGHGVQGDLKALEITHHPVKLLRDTATYPPFLRPNGKSSRLCTLVRDRLGRSIQRPDKFHCCVEDARAALDLYKSAQLEWETRVGTLNCDAKAGDGELSTTSQPLKETTASPLYAGKLDLLNTGSNANKKTAERVECTEIAMSRGENKRAVERIGKRDFSSLLLRSLLSTPWSIFSSMRIAMEKCFQLSVKGSVAMLAIVLRLSKAVHFVFSVPWRTLRYSLVLGRDCSRLLVEGTVMVLRATKLRFGFIGAPKQLKNSKKQKRLQRASQRKRRRLLQSMLMCFFSDDFLLVAIVVFAKIYRDSGWIDYLDHGGLGMSMIAMCILVTVQERRSLSILTGFAVLAYYHIVHLSHSIDEWINERELAVKERALNRSNPYLQAMWVGDFGNINLTTLQRLFVDVVTAGQRYWERTVESPRGCFALYHFLCLVWLALQWRHLFPSISKTQPVQAGQRRKNKKAKIESIK